MKKFKFKEAALATSLSLITFFISIPSIQFRTINKRITRRTNTKPACQILVEELKLQPKAAGGDEITRRESMEAPNSGVICVCAARLRLSCYNSSIGPQ